jgi:CheY-like chemotaxis protein
MQTRPKILIIDDDADIVMLLQLLFKDAGFVADVALDGKEGIEKAASIQPDVILLDIIMPGMDGWEVCRKLRSLPQTESIPIIVLTGIQSEEIDNKAQNMGADYVLIKSCDNSELMSVVSKILEK